MGKHKKKESDEDEGDFLDDAPVKPVLNIQKIESYINHPDDGVKELASTLLRIYGSPEARMYLATTLVVNKLSEELEGFANESILTGTSTDKTFDRINMVFKSMADYHSVLESGRKMMIQMGIMEKKKEAENDIFEQRQKLKDGDTKQE